MCNKEIKFKAFLDKALQLDADYLATSHYAQVGQVDGSFQLLRERIAVRISLIFSMFGSAAAGQGYVPHRQLDQRGGAELAQRPFSHGRKKDSTGICFIGGGTSRVSSPISTRPAG